MLGEIRKLSSGRRDGHACSHHVSGLSAQQGEHVAPRFSDLDFQVNPQKIGEGFCQLVFKPHTLIPVGIVAVGIVSGDHGNHLGTLDFFQRPILTAGNGYEADDNGQGEAPRPSRGAVTAVFPSPYNDVSHRLLLASFLTVASNPPQKTKNEYFLYNCRALSEKG